MNEICHVTTKFHSNMTTKHIQEILGFNNNNQCVQNNKWTTGYNMFNQSLFCTVSVKLVTVIKNFPHKGTDQSVTELDYSYGKS